MIKITDEMVNAAVVAMNTNNLVAYDSLIAQQEANARSILTAALPHLQPVDQTAEIERLRGIGARIIAAFDPDNDLDNPEKFIVYHDLGRAISGKDPS